MKNKSKKYYEQYVDAVYNAGADRKKYHKTWKKIKSFFRHYSSTYLD